MVKEIKATDIAIFMQEVSLLYYFRNTETIIELYGFNMLYLTILLPYFPMGSLQSVIKNVEGVPDWSMQIVLRLSIDIFDAIAVMHSSSVVHYDIKSLNYLVRPDTQLPGLYRAVLTDFGVCIIMSEANLVQGLTINTVNGRTPAFTPPETLI